MNTVYFYKVNEEYGCFSNFSKYSFLLGGKLWITSEHYFQAQKFKGTQYEEIIRNTNSPMEAARMGRDRALPLRSDWEEVKDNVMREAVHSKFAQNNKIKRILLETGDSYIVEKTSTDYYWGCGTEKTGKNMLGIILMEVREQLIKEG